MLKNRQLHIMYNIRHIEILFFFRDEDPKARRGSRDMRWYIWWPVSFNIFSKATACSLSWAISSVSFRWIVAPTLNYVFLITDFFQICNDKNMSHKYTEQLLTMFTSKWRSTNLIFLKKKRNTDLKISRDFKISTRYYEVTWNWTEMYCFLYRFSVWVRSYLT